ncbi:MAG: penicillin-binding protein 2 [Pseudomonadales bacterium]
MKAWRHYAVVILFLLGCSGVAARVVYLNITERAFLQEQGDARAVRAQTLPAYRGVIYDRNGEPLAISTPTMAVWTDPSLVRLDGESVAALAGVLGVPARELQQQLDAAGRREFLYLARRLPWEQAQRVKALELKGVYLQREYRRYYPAAEIAAHVVGVTDVDEAGIEGVELAFDDRLRGQHGRKVVLQDRRGEVIKDLEFVRAPRFGSDMHLSLDLRLQYLAYREIKAAVLANGARSGSLVMLDAHTGEVLAMVNEPSYNPNDLSSGTREGMRNRAVTDTYEPGSTMKPFTALAALESGAYSPTTEIDTSPGYFSVGRKLIQDTGNLGTVSLTRALQKSSQVAFAKVALTLPDRAVFDVMNRAGLGQFVGTGLPGEAAGSLSEWGLDKPIVRATLAYGYGLAVSPLQLARAYVTLANDGVPLPVSILKHDPDAPVTGTPVFAAEQTRAVLHMMEAVTEKNGTAPRASVAGYRVAGKTGTARKVGAAGYDDERHVTLFAGIAPVSNPRLVMVVVINEPAGAAQGGGGVAAPVFGRVAARALRVLGEPPDDLLLAEGAGR